MKKAQIANEFMISIGIAFMILVSFMAIIADEFRYINIDKEYQVVHDFGASLQNEILLASEVRDGYNRQIVLPEKISGYEYSISITGNVLRVKSISHSIEHVYFIPQIIGGFNHGTNLIRKDGGVVYVN